MQFQCQMSRRGLHGTSMLVTNLKKIQFLLN